jgi:hypothetical protein
MGQLEKIHGSTVASEDLPRIVMKFEQPGIEPVFSSGTVGGSGGRGMSWLSAKIPWSISSVFVASIPMGLKQDLTLFGKMELAKQQGAILPALQILEPRLKRLAAVPMARETLIHGDIDLPLLVPVPFMGEGMRRLLSILLAMAESKDGVLLIDEIENGFHYSVQKKVWQAIAAAARQNNVQVFATTHSWECLRWAHEAFSEDTEYDLTLHRLDRGDDETKAVRYDQEMIESALYNALEMR